MVPRWPHPLANVQSPRPRAERIPHAAGLPHADRPAGVFNCDAGARVGAHRVGVHTEPYTSATLSYQLNKDGIWPATRGTQDRRTPRLTRDQYLAADYRALGFEPRLNAATAARSEYSDHNVQVGAGAEGISGRARHLSWQDDLSRPQEAAGGRGCHGGATPHTGGHPCLYPASSLYPSSERLRGALELSLEDARDERAMRGAPTQTRPSLTQTRPPHACPLHSSGLRRGSPFSNAIIINQPFIFFSSKKGYNPIQKGNFTRKKG